MKNMSNLSDNTKNAPENGVQRGKSYSQKETPKTFEELFQYLASYYEPSADETRGRVLLEALDVINGERQQTYGDPEDSFSEIACLWSWYLCARLEDDLAPADVAMMLSLMKLAREKNGAGDTDNVRDACGYLALYEDMRRPHSTEGETA